MKKGFIVLTALLTVASVAACSDRGASSSSAPASSSVTSSAPTSSSVPSSSSSSASSTSSSSQPTPISWPAEEVADLVEKLVPGSLTVIPALEGAEGYETKDAIEEYSCFTVDCSYTSGGIEASEDYLDVLKEEGYTFAGQDNYGYLWYVSSEEDLIVEVGANDTTVQLYCEPYEEELIKEWPSEATADLVEALVPGSESVIPALEGADSYAVYDRISKGYFAVNCYFSEGAEDAAAEYLLALVGADYEYVKDDDYDYHWYASPEEDLVVEVGIFDYQIQLYMEPYTAPATEWPTEAVADFVEALVPGSESVIPALEGAETYETKDYIDDYGAFAVDCSYTSGGQAALTAYISVLEGADYEYVQTDSYGYDWYVSPAEDLVVEVAASDTLVELYVEPYTAPATEWPTEAVADLVEALVPGSESVIPALEGAETYETKDYIDDYGAFIINCSYTSGGEAALTAYVSVLEGAGYEYLKTDGYGYDWYVSPAEDLVVEVYAEDTYVVLYVESYSAPTTEWPTEAVADLVEALLPGSESVIPALDGADEYELIDEYVETFGVFYINCYYESGAEAAFDAYVDVLEGADYEYLGTDSYDYDWYLSPAEDLVVEIIAFDDTQIQLYVEAYSAE